LEPATDIARYIQQGVTDTLRLPQLMAPRSNPTVPDDTGSRMWAEYAGCFREASFFTHHEARLKQDWAQRGGMLGLAYAWMGIPRVVDRAPARP
jgi:hypothetical protein